MTPASDWRRLRYVELRRYRALNWPIFPLRPREKTPATSHGFKDATADRAVWARWFSNGDAGIGLPTGITSGIAVIDIDPRNGGEESLVKIEAEHGPLPESAVSDTGGGGRHLLYLVDQPLRSFKLAPGIDLKVDGGYIVLPPSIHPSGALYRWASSCEPDALPIAPLPDWCRRRPRRPSSAVEHKMAADPETAGERYFVAVVGRLRDDLLNTPAGSRNNSLNRAAFAVGQLAGLTSKNVEWALSCLRAAATAAGLDDHEIQRTIQSGLEAGLAEPRVIVFEPRRGQRGQTNG
jgi:hypothetical protein